MLSDNFFRPRWVGVGDRRLKNSSLFMEWTPQTWQSHMQRRMGVMFVQLSQGMFCFFVYVCVCLFYVHVYFVYVYFMFILC